MKKRIIRYGGALIGKAEKDAIMKVVERNWWPLDKEGELMEKEAAKFLGVKYGLLANSGSSAGLLALAALELPKGSKVVIPAVTFPTIFNIIVQLGFTPVVIDCEIGSYNLSIESLKQALKEHSDIKAVICVHAVGNPCDMPQIMRLSKKHGFKVLEDNCDGWGGTINGRKLGSFGHITFTSFHAAHIVAMGQGGGVFTNDKELGRRARMYRDWGRQSEIKGRTNNNKWKTLPKDQDARFIYEKMGWNLSPLELQAAMGRVQLKKTNKIKSLRKKNYEYLSEKLNTFPQIVVPHTIDGADPSWFSLALSTVGERAPLIDHLEKHGIETRSMFSGNILLHPAYKDVRAIQVGDLKNANWILRHSFWVSCHPRMTQEDREYMVEVFRQYYARSK